MPRGTEEHACGPPTPDTSLRGQRCPAIVSSVVAELERRAGGRCTVGVAHPGAISPATGLVKNANSTRLNGRPLKATSKRALGRRAAGQRRQLLCRLRGDRRRGGRLRIVFGVILGTGVGGGIVIDGRPLVGAQAIAGEWGHNPLPAPRDDERPGPRCYCGRRGCVEAWLSGPAFQRQFTQRTGRTLRATEIAAAAEAGDTEAAAHMELYCDRLARSLAVVVNMLDPDAIVLGGGLSRMIQLYARVPELWKRDVFSERDSLVTRLLPPRTAIRAACGVRRGCGRRERRG